MYHVETRSFSKGCGDLKNNMTVVRTVWIVLTIFYICATVSGEIYSSEMRDEWIDLNSEKGSIVRRSLRSSRHQRHLRDANSKAQPAVWEFELQNDTKHNQALIHWSGNDSKVIFILTRRKASPIYNSITDSTLWRSSNYGKSYERMSQAFDKTAILKSYFISPTNKSKVIFVDAHNHSMRIWLSENEGSTYTPVSVPFSVEKIDFHPVHSSWLLGYDKRRKELYCSMDFGYNWVKLGDEVTNDRYYWYVKNVDTGEHAEKIVYFEYRHLYTAIIRKIFKVKSCYIPDCRPTPFQAKLDKLEQIDSDSLVVQNSYIFVQKSGAANKLYVSHNRGEFSKAMFPYYSSRSQAHFHIVSSDGGCVVIGINHDNGLTHLFFSDEEGKKYTQSLSNMRYFNKKTTDNSVFSVDIYKIQGIIGTYVANVLNDDRQNTTKITWDNGRNWTDITTDVYNMDGVEQTRATCDKCSLNLHLTMEQTPIGYYMQSILAKSSYPGIIVAHGTYGRTVDDHPNNVLVYVSRDNGRSWYAVKEKRHFIVISNHGAVIVAVKMILAKPVTTFSFSSNYGKTWSDHQFTGKGHVINVDGILTEPGEKKAHITLFGHESYQDGWKVYQIDVSPLFPKVCEFPNDFMNVSIPVGQVCHLGMRQKFERLNDGQNCLIQSTYSRVAYVERCVCSRADYECDLGYKSVMSDGTLSCELERLGPIDEIGEDLSKVYGSVAQAEKVKCIGGKRNVSSGMRKVPGNQCKEDVPGIYWKSDNCDKDRITTTTISTTTHQSVLIKRQNTSSILKIGDAVVFSVQGADSQSVVWRVSSSGKEVSKLPHADDKLNFAATEPGEYIVRAEIAGTTVQSQWETVQFWYPIKKVHLYHPPVVAKKTSYNVTALTQTVYGLRGNPTLIGDVGYIWDVIPSETSSISQRSKKNTFIGKPPNSAVPFIDITVTADNTVSKQSTTGRISVADFAVELVMEMECTCNMSETTVTDLWLKQFRSAVAEQLLHMEAVKDVKNKYSLTNEISMYIYVAPGYPLIVRIYLAPTGLEHSKDKLLEAAKQLEAIVAEPPFTVDLAEHMVVKMSKLYVIDYDGVIRVYEPYSATNGAVIAIVIVLVLLVIVVGFIVFRHFSRKMRFDRYLHFRNLRPGNSRSIVRNQDRSPIVDDEFIDDDLNAMEEIGSQDATLQFQG